MSGCRPSLALVLAAAATAPSDHQTQNQEVQAQNARVQCQLRRRQQRRLMVMSMTMLLPLMSKESPKVLCLVFRCSLPDKYVGCVFDYGYDMPRNDLMSLADTDEDVILLMTIDVQLVLALAEMMTEVLEERNQTPSALHWHPVDLWPPLLTDSRQPQAPRKHVDGISPPTLPQQ